MFAHNTNLFYYHKDVKTVFHTIKTELVKVNHWFKDNTLSLNIKNCNLFNKPSTKDDIPLKTSELVISNKLIERKFFSIFLGVSLDECIKYLFFIYSCTS